MSCNLRHYALTFCEKKKESKAKEKELTNLTLEEKFYHIKKKAFYIFFKQNNVHQKLVPNAENINLERIKSNEKEVDDGEYEEYAIDLLSFKHLPLSKNLCAWKYKFLRIYFASNRFYHVERQNQQQQQQQQQQVHVPSISSVAIESQSNTYLNIGSIKCMLQRCLGKTTSFVRNILLRIFLIVAVRCFIRKLILFKREMEILQKAKCVKLPVLYVIECQFAYDVILFQVVLYFIGFETPVILQEKYTQSRIMWLFQSLKKMLTTQNETENIFQILLVNNTHMMKIATLYTSSTKNYSLVSGKYDFLREILSKIEPETISDYLIVSINISHEISTETTMENFIHYKKRKNRIPHFYNRRFYLASVGTVKVNVCKPIYSQEIISRLPRDTTRNTLSSSEQKRDFIFVNEIVTHISYALVDNYSLMPTHLISFLLLYKFRQGVNYYELVKQVDLLRTDLKSKNVVFIFQGSSECIVNHAIEVLKSALTVVKTNGRTIIKPVLYLPFVLKLRKLSYFVLHQYIYDAVILVCAESIFGNDTADIFNTEGTALRFNYNNLRKKSEELCEFLEYSFLFNHPIQSVTEKIDESFNRLTENQVFKKNERFLTDEEKWGHKFAKYLEDSTDSEGSELNYGKLKQEFDDVYYVNTGANLCTYEKIILCRQLLKPVIDTYLLCAENLTMLRGKQITQTELMKKFLFLLFVSEKNGELQFCESVSLDIVKGCIKLFEKKAIIKCCHTSNVKIYYLSKTYNSNEHLAEVTSKIKRILE